MVGRNYRLVDLISTIVLFLITVSCVFSSSLIISTSTTPKVVSYSQEGIILIQNSSIPIQETEKVEVQVLNFLTDKSTYSSRETLKATIIINSSTQLNDVRVNLWGIKPRGYAYINDTKIVNLSAGKNEITFLATTPYCTRGCGGVFPGPYELRVEIYLNEELLDSSATTITLKSD